MNVDEFLSYASTASVIDLSSLCTNRIVGGLLTYKSNITTVYGSNISYIGNRAFSRCTNLSYISIPNVEYIGNSAFCRCFSLTNSCIQDILNTYKSYSTVINSDTFAYCSIATSLDLTGYTRIERSAFEYCRDLVSINTPNCEYINDYAFYYCSNLSYISPISNCSYIGSNAFYYCSNLLSISLPNCSYIGSSAFYSCSKLSAIYMLSKAVPTLSNANAFYSTPISNSTYLGTFGSIYVLSSLVDSFKAAKNWSLYSSRITAYTGT